MAQSLEQEILEIISKHGKLHAVKRYREATGCELNEARQYVEGISPKAAKEPDASLLVKFIFGVIMIIIMCVYIYGQIPKTKTII